MFQTYQLVTKSRIFNTIIPKIANNKYLKSYNLKEESKHITYSDANNLYGYAMSKCFPISEFKWIDPKKFDLSNIRAIVQKDVFFEADLKYPKEIQELHNDYLLAPDKTEIKREIMSEY